MESHAAYLTMRLKIEAVFEHYAAESEYYQRANIAQRFAMQDAFSANGPAFTALKTLRGGDESIRSNLPNLEATDANPCPAPPVQCWCRSTSRDTQCGPGGHSRSPASSNGTTGTHQHVK